MADSSSRLAYNDIENIFIRALEAKTGTQLLVDDYAKAVVLRRRAYKLRALDRAHSIRSRAPEDPMRGLSEYDRLTMEILTPDGRNITQGARWIGPVIFRVTKVAETLGNVQFTDF